MVDERLGFVDFAMVFLAPQLLCPGPTSCMRARAPREMQYCNSE